MLFSRGFDMVYNYVPMKVEIQAVLVDLVSCFLWAAIKKPLMGQGQGLGSTSNQGLVFRANCCRYVQGLDPDMDP